MARTDSSNRYCDVMDQIMVLLSEGPMSGVQLRAALGNIPKSSFSNIKDKLINLGYIEKQGKLYCKSEKSFHAITKNELEEWMLMFILVNEENALSTEDIFVKYEHIKLGKKVKSDDIHECSLDAENPIKQRVRMVLNNLVKKGLIDKKRDRGNKYLFEMNARTPIAMKVDYDQLEVLMAVYKLGSSSKYLEDLSKRINTIDGLIERSSIRSFGRRNSFEAKSLVMMEKLFQTPYKTKALRIKTKDRTFTFEIGTIIFSEETNEFYLIGDGSKGYPVRLSSIETLEVTEKNNTIFENDYYLSMVDEMFDVAMDGPYDVVVRFRNVPYIRRKIERLAEKRNKTAVIEESENPVEFIYRDKMRGLSGFSRYLRGMCRNAIVEEPLELKNMMLATVDKINAIYDKEQ